MGEVVSRETWDISLSPWAARLDAMDEGFALAMEIGENRADGEVERDIARRLGVKRGQLRMWLKATTERWAAFCAGYEARADELVDETIEIADGQARVVRDAEGRIEMGNDGKPIVIDGDPQRDALRVKARQWYAERANKGRWGNQPASMSVQAVGNITIIHQSE